MSDVKYLFSNKLTQLSLFLIPALLLSSKNGSVYVIGLLGLYSIFFLIKNRRDIVFDQFDWCIIVLLTAYVIANIPVSIIDHGSMRYFKGGSRYLACIPIYFYIKATIKDYKIPVTYLEWGTIVGSVGTMVLALYQTFIEGRPRVDGFLYSINFGYLACALAFLALTLSKSSKNKYFLYVAFLLCTFSTLLTLTRGAIFAIPVLILLTVIFYQKEHRLRRVIIMAITAIALFSILLTFSPSLKQRMQYTGSEVSDIISGKLNKAQSSGTRIELWYAATQAFLQHPLTGATYQQREEINHQLFAEGKIDRFANQVRRGHAHNQYFEMLAGNGILGIAAFCILLFAPMIYFFRNISNSNHAYSGFIFVVGFAIYCLTEVPLEQNLIATFYAFMVPLFIRFTELDKLKQE